MIKDKKTNTPILHHSNTPLLQYSITPIFKKPLSYLLLFFVFSIIVAGHYAWAGGAVYSQNRGIRGNLIVQAITNRVYYENTIKNIISQNCGRCHSGVTRNLMDYDNLKTYAVRGMLGAMVQGPMGRFAENDTRTILLWIENGSPKNPRALAVGFFPTPAFIPGRRPTNMQRNQITYTNTIKTIMAKDCLRCHSGPFRDLTTYENLKIYVKNGLLEALVLPGGPMHRFAGPDSRYIVFWVNNGAPL